MLEAGGNIGGPRVDVQHHSGEAVIWAMAKGNS